MKIPIIEPVYLLKGRNPFPYCNCLLIEDDSRTVVDTGMEQTVLQECDPHKVGLVLNSHAHLDHMHGNRFFPDAQIGFHPITAAAAQDPEVFGQDYILALWSRMMTDPLNLEYKLDQPGDGLLIKESVLISFPSSRVDFTFKQGDELDLGRVKLKVLHTPGHCQGHCCFYWEKEGLLFSADIDFLDWGPWYFNESADIDEFIESIRQIIEINPRIIIPGHGRLVKAPIVKAAGNYLEHFNRRDEMIMRVLKKPCTLEDFVNRNLIFPKYIRPTQIFWERVMVFKHLNRLIKLGEVQEKDGLYYLA